MGTHISMDILVDNTAPPTLLPNFRCGNCWRLFSMSPHWLQPLGQSAWAVLVLGWMQVVLLARTASPCMSQANVSSASPYSPFVLSTMAVVWDR